MSDLRTERAVDRAVLQRVVARQAAAAQAPWLHGEVARRMAERLALVRRRPALVIDWWSHAGASHPLLRRAYPQARLLRVEPAGAPTPGAAPWWSPRRWRDSPGVTASAVPERQAQLLWANMMVHSVADPGALFAAWRGVLAVDGFLMFSTLGPDTLKGLREIYRDAGWGAAHAPFIDMHDLGDMLVHAGFADPVMDQELLCLTWATPAALRDELRTLGANAEPTRHGGLRTPRWRARLDAALAERAGADGRIGLEFEVVYGHAFVPPPRVAVAAQTRLSAEQLRDMARAGRRSEPLG
jgi:malonyl-CoA O-methyltransferase